MIAMNILLEADGAFTDLAGRADVVHVTRPITIACLAHGTVQGNPTVFIRLDLPDGRTVLAETTMRLFLAAAAAMRGRFGDLV